MIIINDDIKKVIHKKLLDILPDNSGIVIHGTFASGKSKYISDVDLEVYLHLKKNKDELIDDIQNIINNIEEDNDIFFNDCMIGLDKRFNELDIKLNKNLTYPTYDYKKCKHALKELYNKKIIRKKEHDELDKFIIKNPSYMDIIGLKLFIEDNLKFIHWTEKQLLSKKRTYRKKSFKLKDVIVEKKYPNIIMTTIRISKDVYVPVDITILYYHGKELFSKKTFIKSDDKRHEIMKFKMATDVVRYKDLYRFYYGMFKNYYQQKWMKCLKRLRTLISGIIYEKGIKNANNRAVKSQLMPRFKEMKLLREEIADLNNTILGMLNQLKNQFSTLHDLVGRIPNSDIIRITNIKIRDINMCLENSSKINNSKLNLEKYITLSKISDTELKRKLKALNKDIFLLLNQRAYPIFINYYHKVKSVFPFKFDLKTDFK
jgi:hypothetical protein